MTRLFLAFSFLSIAVLNLQAQQSSRLIVATQVTPDHNRHMLLEVLGPESATLDKIVIKLPKEVDSSKIIEGTLPQGWSAKIGRNKITVSGPTHALPFRARLEMGRQAAPLQVNTLVSNGKEKIYTREGLILKVLPPLVVKDKLRGLLALPPLMTPGDTLEMRLLNPLLTPPDGTWTIAGVEVNAQPDPLLTDAKGNSGWLLRLTVPEINEDTSLAVSYHNALGMRTVHVTKDLHTRFVPAPKEPPHNSKPRLVSCATRGVRGGGLCVGGWFPTDAARNGLLIDGKPAGVPISASNQALFVPLLPSISPGKHVLSGSPEAGFDPSQQVEFELIDVQAELDKAELVEGQMAELSFFIVGSKSAMKIRVINTTPEIISIDEGDEQVIETFGGGGNIATRTIETRALGNFIIRYELAEPRCPCTESLNDNNLIP